MKKSGPMKNKTGMRGGGMAKKKAMRGGGMAKKKAGMRGGGMAKKSGPAKKKIMKGGGMAKKAGPAKKKVMKKGGMAKKAGPMKGMAMGGRGSMDTGSRSGGLRVLPRGMKPPPQPKINIDPAVMAKARQELSRKPMATGGTAKSATSVRMNRGAPKVRTVKARGRGAATKGTQFRENT